MKLSVLAFYKNNKKKVIDIHLENYLTDGDIRDIFNYIKCNLMSIDDFSRYSKLVFYFVDSDKYMSYEFKYYSNNYKVVMSLLGKYLKKLIYLYNENNQNILILNQKGVYNYEEGKNSRSTDCLGARSGCDSGVCGQRNRESNQEEGSGREIGEFRDEPLGCNSFQQKNRSANNSLSVLSHARPLIEIPNVVSAESFRKAMLNYKSKNNFSLAVDIHDLDDYKTMKCSLYDNGNAGIAIEKSGNIVSVFKSRDSKIKGFAIKATKDAISMGGKKLDCYSMNNDFLPNQYMRAGMKPICKIKFNREYAPDGWNYERDGEPDIVFMALGENTHDFYAEYTDEEVPYFEDDLESGKSAYELASEYRDRVLDRQFKIGKSVRKSRDTFEIVEDLENKVNSVGSVIKNIFSRKRE